MAANLAISDNDTVVQYTSIGESIFPFPFPFLDNDEIKVSVNQALQVLGVDYTLSGLGDAGGGTVTFTSATTAGELITIWQDMPFKRLTGFSTGAATLAGEDLNTEFARQVRHDQQVRRDIRRALRLPVDDSVSGTDMELAPVATRKGLFLRFADVTGAPEYSEIIVAGTVLSQSVIAGFLNPLTPKEILEGIPVTNFEFREGEAERYGLVADGDGAGGGTDNTTVINAISAFGANQDVDITLPHGIILITDTWFAAPEGSSGLRPVVRGAGRGYVRGEGLTIIDATLILLKPALNIPIARAPDVTDFQIIGPNLAPALLSLGSLRFDSAWVTGGVRDSRYSPQCAICIDGGTGATPPDGGYSGFTYPGGNAGTHDWTLRRISASGHVVAIMINPGLGAQGDVGLIDDCNLQDNKIHIASGQAQANAITVQNTNMSVCRTCFDGVEYGNQQGDAPVFINCQYINCFEMFQHGAGISPLLVLGGLSEGIHRIGRSGRGFGSTFVSFTCKLLADGIGTRAPHVWDSPNGGLTFIGGGLDHGSSTGVSTECYNIVADNAVFEDVDFRMKNEDRAYIGGQTDLNNPTVLRNSRVIGLAGPSTKYGSDARQLALPPRISEHWSPRPHSICSTLYEYIPKVANNYKNIGTQSNEVYTATTYVFDNTDAAGGIMVGDLIMMRIDSYGGSVIQTILPGAVVTSVAAPTVTCDLLFGRDYYDETFLEAFTRIVQHFWAPGQALTGDTNSDNQLTNVSPITILQDGDWITAASGIPANTRVLSGGGTATITLSRNATDTAASKTLYWDRLHTITTAAAF